MATARYSHTATPLADGTVLITGGINGSYLAGSELYYPATGTFSTTGSMGTTRGYHTATRLADGKVLITGGFNGSYLAGSELYDPTTGTFSSTGSMGTTRRYHTATLLTDGKVLIKGGDNGSYPVSTERYDPATGIFSTTGSMVTARQYHTATRLSDGKVLITGGINGPYLASTELYDPATGTFSTTASMATARYSHTATLLTNGKVLITGGYGNTGYLSSAELYDPATGTFSSTASMATARYSHTATLLTNGKVLITGGLYGSYLSSAELYDPATGTFSTTGSMVSTRTDHTATLLTNGKVLITGGYGNTGYLSSAELYDPATGTFSSTGNMGTTRRYHTATLLADGKVLITGGINGSYLASTEQYDPATGTFLTTGSMATSRDNHTATLLADGRVLITGGYGNTGYLSSAELYVPATGTFSTTGNMATARQYHTATLLADGQVLIAGGYNGSYLASYELFDAYSGFIMNKYTTGGTFLSLQVRSETNGQPIAGASVSVDNGIGVQTTDANGYATFFIATPQLYNISVSAASYLPVTITNRSVSGYRTGLGVYMTPPDLLNITSTSLKPAQATLAFDDRILFTGADWPYTISKISGQLPTGVFLYPATGQLAGTPGAPGSYTFMVRITDKDGWTAEREFTIEVSNPLNIVPVRLPRATAAQPYFGVLGTEGGTAPYTYGISGPYWLSLDNNGALKGTAPSIAADSESQNFTVTLQDALGRTTSKNFTMNIDKPLLLGAVRTNDGITGTAYSQNITASGGLAPYAWSLYSGALPAGLNINTTGGFIYGTPTNATRSVFILAVTDADGRITYNDYVINVAAPLQIVTTTPPNGYKNAPYSELVKISGGLPPYSYSYTGQLPNGLTLDPATGIISGLPSIAGLTNLNIKVQDGTYPTAQSVSRDMQSRIVTTLAITTSGALPNARRGVAINPVVLTAKGGTSPYTWALDSGTMPPGLSLAAGVLSGTPAKQGDYIFTLAVTDSATTPMTEKKQFICHVSDTLEIVRMDLPNAAVGVAYSQSLQATGGIPASYTWRLNGGTLPDGLTFNPATATILGIPTNRQSYSFTIEASDGDFTPQTATRTFVIDVVDALNIAEVTIPNGRNGEAYSTTLHPLKGAPPYSWRIVNGILPAGLAFAGSATNSQITGKPAAHGIYSFDVEVSDSSIPSAIFTRRYTMEVYDTVTFLTSELRTVVRGQIYDEALVVIGGARATATSGIFDPLSGSFTSGESMWVNRLDYSATTLQNGKVLIVGGRSGATPIASAELYDPLTKTFTPTAGNLATARYLHSATLLKNGKVLISGGNEGASGPLASAELYDPATNSFSGAGPMNGSRVYHTATLLNDGRVLITGGNNTIGTHDSAETYNPSSNTFTLAGYLQSSRRNHRATLLTDGRILISGGFNNSAALQSSAELFDPLTDLFTAAGYMLSQRSSHSSTLLADGKVLLAGGVSLTGVATASAETYDPASSTFSATSGNMTTSRLNHSATLLDNGTVLLSGGYNTTLGDMLLAELYVPGTRSFSPLGTVSDAVRYQDVAKLGNGTLLFPGGYNEQYTFSRVQGQLPDGILLDEKTGKLYGVSSWPAGTSSEVTFQVVDSGSPLQTAEQKILFKVVDPLAVTTARLTAQQNTAYSLALEAAGGISPYISWDIVPTWSANNGALPPGLAINRTTGVISGTPTLCGTFPVRARVVDSWIIPNQVTNDLLFDVGCMSGKYMLLVQKEGTGSGTVTSSSPTGISCGISCGMEMPHNSSITLTATPTTGSRFTGWSGACSGTSTSCSISMAANMTATASFSLVLEPSGSIAPSGGASYVKANPVPLALSASSPLAAISKMQFSVNQSPWGSLVPYATSHPLNLTSGDGTYSIAVRFQDANGNFSPVNTTSVTLDTARPLVTGFDVPGTNNSATVPVTSFTASDLNGIAGYYISTSSTPPVSGSTLWSDSMPLSHYVAGITPGVQTAVVLYAFVKDVAGNISMAANSTVVITIPSQQLSVTLQGSGKGSVNSNPAGIACSSGTCSAYFDTGTNVTLLPTPAWNSDFKGWGSAPTCTTTGSCQVTLNGQTTVTALFEGKPAYLVWLVDGGTSSAFYGLNEVFAAASNGAAVLSPLNIFTEDVLISSNALKSVNFNGGFDPSFKYQSGYTVVNGTVTFGKGANVVVDRLVIR